MGTEPAHPAGPHDAAWEEFKKTQNPDAREKLILAYAPLVKYVAGRVSIGLPPNIDFDDLVSYGMFGLVDAVEKFDLSRGVKFETYAINRIRGAIIDGLRAADWVPRSVRQKAKEMEKAIATLEARLGRPAEDEEIALALGISLADYHRLINELHSIALASLDEVWAKDSDDESGLRIGQMVENVASEDPMAEVAEKEVKRLLAEAIDALPERERLVISLYYYERLTLKEIGQALSVSESRVSQLHTRALLRLRGRLAWIKESLVS